MNKEKLRDSLEKVKAALGKISKKIWIIIGVCLVVMAGVIIFLVWSNQNKPYAVLIDRANNEEFSSVLTWLQDQGITDYKTEGSSAILVPADQAVVLKARLLQQQYSSVGSSPSLYFERVGALSTQIDREKASKEDLERQLNAVIRSFSGVLDATVIINFGEDNGYVLYKNNVVDASASVKVTMQQGKLLSSEQATAIRNYVAHAVPNLNVDNVYLTDTIGNTYSDFSAGNSQSDSVLMLQVKEELENRLRTQITQALAKGFLGEENVSVVPNVTVELGDKTVNTHDVKLPSFAQDGSTGGRGIIGSEFWIFQFLTPDQGAYGGVVGTTTNADLPTYVEPGQAQAELQRILEEEANRIYDNSYEDVTMVIHCATVTDVSVAVWVNGGVLKDPSQINKDDLRNLVAAAAHIEPVLTDEVTREDYLNWKIQVMTDPFATLEPDPIEPEPINPEPEPGTLWGVPFWVFIAAGVGLLVFVAVLVLILVLRGKKRKKEEAERQALIETMMAAAEPGQIVQLDEDGNPVYVEVGGEPELDEEGNPVTGANVMDLHTERSMELRQSIRDFVDENMEVAALLLKSWMKEGGESG